MKKHTPGPWKSALAVVSNAPSIYVITNGKWGAPNLAQVYDEADARLIAAAPEMLEALKVADIHISHRQGDCYSDDYMGACICGKEKIQAAIAKGERRS